WASRCSGGRCRSASPRPCPAAPRITTGTTACTTSSATCRSSSTRASLAPPSGWAPATRPASPPTAVSSRTRSTPTTRSRSRCLEAGVGAGRRGERLALPHGGVPDLAGAAGHLPPRRPDRLGAGAGVRRRRQPLHAPGPRSSSRRRRGPRGPPTHLRPLVLAAGRPAARAPQPELGGVHHRSAGGAAGAGVRGAAPAAGRRLRLPGGDGDPAAGLVHPAPRHRADLGAGGVPAGAGLVEPAPGPRPHGRSGGGARLHAEAVPRGPAGVPAGDQAMAGAGGGRRRLPGRGRGGDGALRPLLLVALRGAERA